MQEYHSKDEFVQEIKRTAGLFVGEFEDITEADRDLRLEGVDRTPQEILAYQLGWMGLLRGWDEDERAGKEVVTPAPGCKWNQLRELYQGFYRKYSGFSLAELAKQYTDAVEGMVSWVNGFSDEELFQPGGRKWAQSTPSNWPVWKWVSTNTIAPNKSFRSKIRKWKKLRAQQGEA